MALGLFFAGLFAWYTVYRENAGNGQIMTATQIAVLPYLLLLAAVALVNPLLRLMNVVRIFTATELLVIFLMGAVSSGIATFGMASQLVPAISGLMNRHWNNRQSRWDIAIEANVNEKFFIAADGLRDTAHAFAVAEAEWRAASDALRLARQIDADRGSLAENTDELKAAAKIADAVERRARQDQLLRDGHFLRGCLRESDRLWSALPGRPELSHVLKEYPRREADLADRMAAAEAALRAREAEAFDLIDVVRRGLPEEKRAIPGFFYTSGEGISGYLARWNRMVNGTAIQWKLRRIARGLAREPERGGLSARAAREHILVARRRLARLADQPRLEARRADLARQIQESNTRRQTLDKRVRTLQNERRGAVATQFDRIDAEIDDASDTARDQRKRIESLTAKLDKTIMPRVKIAQRIAQIGAVLDALAAELAAEKADRRAIGDRLAAVIETFNTIDATFRRFWLGEADWRPWLKPLSNWLLLIGLTYLMLMMFNLLIFRQWAHEEKLIYPLAELPLMISGAGEKGDSFLPSLFRSGMFWGGVAISGGVMGWNLLVRNEFILGGKVIPLTTYWRDYIQGSFLNGLMPYTNTHIFFTLIGLSFLVPAAISGSLWFFQIVYMLLLLLLVWHGYGWNENSFPKDMSLVLNFQTALGGGALIVFALVILWKCRRYLLCAWLPRGIRTLETNERHELQVASWLFMASSAALILVLSVNLGTHWLLALFCYLVILMVTIGLTRAVSEGGVLGFQCWFNPFHLLRTGIGLDKAWVAPPVLAPLVIYYSVLFWDIKTFIAPAMANALKVRDTLRMERLRFHAAILLGIGGAIAVALITHIMLAYHRGADNMHPWFYRNGPQAVFNSIREMTLNPVDTVGGAQWLLAGMAAMAALLFFRRRYFFLPHPIGLLMFVNPVLMRNYWFSIFLGWACKALVSRYGDKHTYASFRCFFIGLIVGELIMCLFGLDLNRSYGT